MLDINIFIDVLYTMYKIPCMATYNWVMYLCLNEFVYIKLYYLQHVVQLIGVINAHILMGTQFTGILYLAIKLATYTNFQETSK